MAHTFDKRKIVGRLESYGRNLFILKYEYYSTWDILYPLLPGEPARDFYWSLPPSNASSSTKCGVPKPSHCLDERVISSSFVSRLIRMYVCVTVVAAKRLDRF